MKFRIIKEAHNVNKFESYIRNDHEVGRSSRPYPTKFFEI